MKVLVLEDDVMQAESLALLLKDYGHVTFLAGDGVQAEAEVRVHHIDAAVLDVVTPSMDTVPFLAWLRGQPEMGKIPVVLITGLDLSHLGSLVMTPGVKVLRKPYEVSELLTALGVHSKVGG